MCLLCKFFSPGLGYVLNTKGEPLLYLLKYPIFLRLTERLLDCKWYHPVGNVSSTQIFHFLSKFSRYETGHLFFYMDFPPQFVNILLEGYRQLWLKCCSYPYMRYKLNNLFSLPSFFLLRRPAYLAKGLLAIKWIPFIIFYV